LFFFARTPAPTKSTLFPYTTLFRSYSNIIVRTNIGGKEMALPNFEENLQKYAKLLVAKGLNVQPNDWVKVTISVDQAPLARLITKEAYALGAEKVIIKWSDDEITKQHYIHQPEEVLTDIPKYEIEESEDHVLNHRVCRLSILSNDPG